MVLYRQPLPDSREKTGSLKRDSWKTQKSPTEWIKQDKTYPILLLLLFLLDHALEGLENSILDETATSFREAVFRGSSGNKYRKCWENKQKKKQIFLNPDYS